MGLVTKERTANGKPVWCVRNETNRRVIKSQGRFRCYTTRREAVSVWHKLDCKYTGRWCGSPGTADPRRRPPGHVPQRS
jgi:hypothetical protein